MNDLVMHLSDDDVDAIGVAKGGARGPDPPPQSKYH